MLWPTWVILALTVSKNLVFIWTDKSVSTLKLTLNRHIYSTNIYVYTSSIYYICIYSSTQWDNNINWKIESTLRLVGYAGSPYTPPIQPQRSIYFNWFRFRASVRCSAWVWKSWWWGWKGGCGKPSVVRPLFQGQCRHFSSNWDGNIWRNRIEWGSEGWGRAFFASMRETGVL